MGRKLLPGIRLIVIAGVLLGSSIFAYAGIAAGTTQPGAEFKISDLVVPAEVNAGAKLTISATITNSATTDGNYEATLNINGVKEATQVVNVPPRGFKAVNFTLSRNEAGSYEVDLDGLKGSFVVVNKTDSSDSAAGMPMALVIAIIVVVALAVLAALWLILRKRARA